MNTRQKPVVVFVFVKNRGESSTRFGGFVTRLQKNGHLKGVTPRYVALEDLVFVIDSKQEAKVIDRDGNPVFEDASLVYFKSWESDIESASALANYLSARGIPFIDEVVSDMGVSKLSQLFKLWREGVQVTPFIYAQRPLIEADIRLLKSKGKLFLKPSHGQKGQGTMLVDSAKEAEKVVATKQGMLVQPYVQNDGDYRVLVYGYRVRGALYRQAAVGSIVNNTSAGATSTYLPPKDVPESVRKLAIKAARATHHAVAGVDVMVDSRTQDAYILEVNQGSQIVTGQWTEQKMAAFGAFIDELVQSRYPRKKRQRLSVIGRHIHVDLPELGVVNLVGKVDTGAYQSALHVEDINVADGVLHFSVPQFKDGKLVEMKAVQTDEFDTVQVTNTSGKPEKRYRIKTLVNIHGKEYRTPVTLTNRGGMKSPMLLGRRLLRGRYLVNPELSRKAHEEIQ